MPLYTRRTSGHISFPKAHRGTASTCNSAGAPQVMTFHAQITATWATQHSQAPPSNSKRCLPLTARPLGVHLSEQRLHSLWFHSSNTLNFLAFDFIFLTDSSNHSVRLYHEHLHPAQGCRWGQKPWTSEHLRFNPDHSKSNAESKHTLSVTTPSRRWTIPPRCSAHSDFYQNNTVLGQRNSSAD